MKLTVAMISKNEEGAVGKVIDDIKRYAPGAEIVLVDSSSDRTPQIAEERGAKVVRQFPPRGYGYAMLAAFEAATGEVVVTMDCDDTYPAEDIVALARLVTDEGYDIVDATRLGSRPDAMPFSNYLANVLFAKVASAACGTFMSDVHSGMRAYRTQMLREVKFDPSGPALPVELWLKPIVLGYRAAEVTIPYRERIGITTLQPYRGTWWTFKRIARIASWKQEAARAQRPRASVTQVTNFRR